MSIGSIFNVKPPFEKHIQPADAVETVLFGGLTAGLLDAFDAIIVSGGHATRVFQTVASGLLGSRAFEGGNFSAALGVGLHFSIALSAAAVYLGMSRRAPLLIRRPVASGVGFGLGVWAFMNFVVLPLSQAPGDGHMPTFAVLTNQLLIHAFGFGLPIALFASRSTHRTSNEP
jgi:hypothetical protein